MIVIAPRVFRQGAAPAQVPIKEVVNSNYYDFTPAGRPVADDPLLIETRLALRAEGLAPRHHSPSFTE
jgi:hypothetical protein